MPPEKPKTGKAKLAATVGAGAATLLLGTVAAFEGKRNDPYADLIGKATVCYGETNVAMRHYSNAECEDMLAGSLSDYASAVLTRNPELVDHPSQVAAATSLAYNAGIGNYRRSSVARLFSAGAWHSACDHFLDWSYARGKQIPGLLRRRRAERDLCLRNLP